jgi:bifunctional non-homologous end joining protein LigD
VQDDGPNAVDVSVSHPEKVLFPNAGITKGELCAYYASIAPLMIPHISGRPITMERYPAGIDKKGFIQKDVAKGFPAWLERIEVQRREGGREGGDEGGDPKGDKDGVHYALAGDTRSLVWLANQNSITPHVWTSRVPTLQLPDLCVFDLDPSDDDPKALQAAALAVRDLLTELGLPSFVKTSGSKGFHIVVPLDGAADFTAVWRFAHGTGALLVKRHAELFTQEFIKADRGGRILIDTGRNGPGATFAAVYAVRPKPDAPVSAPCTWLEVEQGTVGPRAFTLRTMAARVGEVGDLWQDIASHPCSLAGALNALDERLTDEDWNEAHAASTRRPVSRKGRRKS